MKRLMMLVPALVALAALTAATPAAPPADDTAHYLSQFVDTSVSPRIDFFQYAVGGWLKAHPIPAAERSWGIGKVVQEETYHRLIQISERAGARRSAARGSNAQKIGDFWHAAMDTVTIAKQGITPLADAFRRIGAARDAKGLLTTMAYLQTIGVDAMCSLAIFQDEKKSDRFAVHLYQGGIGMPNRDYYFDSDERSTMLRGEYVKHVANMFRLLGDADAKAQAEAATVMKLETELAGASRKLEALRDPIANYNAMSVAGMSTLTPSIGWREFLADGRVTGIDSVIVGQPEFFKQVETSLKNRPLDDWKTYLRWQTAHAFAAEAGGKFDAENFHFYGTILNGTKQQRPRWKRMLDEEEGYLGDALGQLYVQQYFSPRAKARYEKLTDEIFAAFRERIHTLEWMSPETKARALKKLDAVTKKVGYPSKWRDYSAYAVDRTSFLGNCVRGNAWRTDFYVAKLHKPVDRTEWEMTPQTYNAYYNPSNNEIVLPAAAFILPGIPDSLVDDALVYSYAGGSTIGHEITHGFDDEGRQFDEKGNLQEWWTPQDAKEFKQRAARIVRQFNGYVAVDSLHVNGEATQGENIADLGGILLGWDAFAKTEQYRRNQPIGGFTPAQRYFIGWALSWMNQLRPENLAVRVKTDVHAPSFLRVTGPISNLPQFYAAYGVKPGDTMYRADSVRVSIW
ncbi:MAG: M13 family metallopeptidase [Candidatus Eisenbacteria bacterium]|nr:M13 family metallopeptidase [Candidatus Eisenbacteria bacterium]